MSFLPDSGAMTPPRVISVIQGDYRVAEAADVVLSTVLGSCVSVALYDPMNRIGGMNHYLLPASNGSGATDVKYGALAIELLINALLKKGACRSEMRAKLCGGASIIATLGNIGARNADFARDFMKREGFRIMSEDLGGTQARRFQFHPVSGATKVALVAQHDTGTVAAREGRTQSVRSPEITLF